MNIERTRENLTDVDIDEKAILKFADNQYRQAMTEKRGSWNGRQIRNAFQTAIALAQWEAKANKIRPKLSVDRFKQVAQASLDFDLYLATVHGGDEESRASTVRERASHWGEAPPSNWGGAPSSKWEIEPPSNYRAKSSKLSKRNQYPSETEKPEKEKSKKKATSKGDGPRGRAEKPIVKKQETSESSNWTAMHL